MEYGHRLRQVVKEDFDWLLDLRRATMDPHIRASGDEPLEEVHREAVLKDYDSTRIKIARRIPLIPRSAAD